MVAWNQFATDSTQVKCIDFQKYIACVAYGILLEEDFLQVQPYLKLSAVQILHPNLRVAESTGTESKMMASSQFTILANALTMSWLSVAL